MAGIDATTDALTRSRSNAAPNLHGTRLNEATHTVFDAEHIGDDLLVGSAPIPLWLEDEHIAADFALLGEALHRASPDIAARTRLVMPVVAHFLRVALEPAEAAADYHDIIEGGTASFVFLPISNAGTGCGGTHWSLLFVDLRGHQPVAYHYDSAGTLNSAHAKGLAARLGARLDRVRMAQQDNGYDCGVFVVDATRALAARLAEGERPGSQPLHLDTLVADRQALLDRLTAPSNARVELASSSRSRERSYGGR
ncbi:hypothetical protein GOL93_32660 [Sinorhizobium medicae]|nr:hypothetical protein [Sinorhizobium medicae]MDX1195730.1 hypothetical protein [Sinorhizobium medicae]